MWTGEGFVGYFLAAFRTQNESHENTSFGCFSDSTENAEKSNVTQLPSLFLFALPLVAFLRGLFFHPGHNYCTTIDRPRISVYIAQIRLGKFDDFFNLIVLRAVKKNDFKEVHFSP